MDRDDLYNDHFAETERSTAAREQALLAKQQAAP
jgi:hypothetical protein